MRWKQRPRKGPPERGAVRVTRKFLFFPKTLEGETRWLEVAYIVQRYVPARLPGGAGYYRTAWWWNRRWATKDEYAQSKRAREEKKGTP